MSSDQEKPERIAKRIARAGVCSRREAEALILAGKVRVNGETLASPAFTVTKRDEIYVNGKILPKTEKTRLWLYHKPVGLVTTTKDPQGRPTVFDALSSHIPRVISVGRLDLNTEGLLLLTNDGQLSRVLENPQTGLVRRYKVRVFGDINEKKLQNLKQGAKVDSIQYGPIQADVIKQGKSNSWLQVQLAEGKNREVRKVLDSIGLKVNRLIREQYGPFSLGTLEKNKLAEVVGRRLKERLGGIYEIPT